MSIGMRLTSEKKHNANLKNMSVTSDRRKRNKKSAACWVSSQRCVSGDIEVANWVIFHFKKIFQLLFASYVLINGIFTSFWAFCNLNNQNRTIITILTIFSDFKTTPTYILWWLFWFKILLINCLKTNSLWPL